MRRKGFLPSFLPVAMIAVAVFEVVYWKHTVSLREFVPDRPPGAFDLTTIIVFAGVVWGLTGAIAGAVLDTKNATVGGKRADVPVT